MPLHKLILKPGITTEATQAFAQGTWAKSDKIRWRDGFLEKQFGWQEFTNELIAGICRALHSWMTADRIKYLAIGTNLRLEIWSLGALTDITPLRLPAQNVPVSVATTNGDTTVIITDVAHLAIAGDEVYIQTPISIDGLILHGHYTITTIVDVDHYTIEAASVATSTTSGGVVPVFNTTIGSSVVTVTFPNHGFVTGDQFTVDVQTTVGGLILIGGYTVDTVIDANNFTFFSLNTATSTATAAENGGNAQYLYLMSAGLVSTAPAIGYGSGGYGSGTWGSSPVSTTAVNPLRIWSLDNFQDVLVAAPRNGPLYEWTPPIGPYNRATLTPGAPNAMYAMFVTTPQLQIIALGAEVLGIQDPMLVRWCEAGDRTVWTATITNLAGSYRLSRGSQIMAGLQGPQANYIWTDIDLWIMQYVGFPNVYSFQILSTGCGLAAQKAVGVLAKSIYWMSFKGFFVFSGGGVQQLACAVWDNIFQDFDTANIDKIFAAPDAVSGEITWYYPSLAGGTGENDSYVKYNTISGEWDYGTSTHTAWLDQNVFGPPIGAHSDGDIHQHGVTYNAHTMPLASFAETGFIDIAEGDQMIFLDEIIPDLVLKGINPEVYVTINTKSHTFGDDVVSHGPFTINNDIKFITLRARARMMSMKIESTALDVWWRLGAVRVRVAPDGRSP